MIWHLRLQTALPYGSKLKIASFMYTNLILEKSNSVATITLNRPDVYNALDNALRLELQDALKDVGQDSQVRVVVITGAGKAFCSGQDLKAAAKETVSVSDSLRKGYNPIIKLMRDMAKPIICRLNGIAAGAGCSLALACDMIVAAEEAAMSEAFVHIGLVPDAGSSYFLPRLVGPQRAFELVSMGGKLSAKEALEKGMVNKVVPMEDLDDAIKHYTDYYAQAPTKAIGIMKRMLNKSLHSSLDTMLEYEVHCQETAVRTKDHKEGVRAFMEKRKAEFKGE